MSEVRGRRQNAVMTGVRGGRDRCRKVRRGTAAAWILGLSVLASPGGPARLGLREVVSRPARSAPCLFRPSAMACDRDGVYVLDAGDADIKVFAPDGAFLRSVGRKGSAPGEFRMPADIDVHDGRLYVADSGNRRIQVLDRRGVYLRGFGVKQMPWKVLALDGERTIVAHLASGLSNPEKMVTCYVGNGIEDWRTFDASVSGDPAGDALRNQVSLCRSPGGGFWIVKHFDDRVIRRLGSDGRAADSMAPPETDLPFRDIAVPAIRGEKRLLRALCRACAEDAGRLFLLLPDYTEDGDLGPGKTIAVLGESGKVESTLDLPERMSRIAVVGDAIYALDLEPRLRIFRWGRG